MPVRKIQFWVLQKMCAKLKQAVDNRNERLVNKTQQDMGEQFRTF